MKIKEVLISNKAIEKISYYAIDKDDSQMLAIKNKIHAVWNNHFIDRRGYKKSSYLAVISNFVNINRTFY